MEPDNKSNGTKVESDEAALEEYQPPAITDEAAFDTVTLGCGVSGSECAFNPPDS